MEIMRHMFKINTSIFYPFLIASLCIFVSCNKTGQVENKLHESQVKTKNPQDSIKSITEPLKDTILQKTNKPNSDSLKAIKEKKRKNDSLKALKETEVKIRAYYFHPTARCVTCRNIEAYSLEAVQQWEDKNNKKVAWAELNIEDSLNEHFVKEYNLEFSSLVIVKYIGTKKDKWKNLEETWKLVNDKSTFIKYVMNELDQFNKEN
jgi:hypothetical protein